MIDWSEFVPEKPVDRTELTWWQIYPTVGPRERKAVYYEAATWEEYCAHAGKRFDPERQGHPMQSEWMLHEFGYARERIDTEHFRGWKPSRDCFLTEWEAVAELTERHERERARLEDRVDELRAEVRQCLARLSRLPVPSGGLERHNAQRGGP